MIVYAILWNVGIVLLVFVVMVALSPSPYRPRRTR